MNNIFTLVCDKAQEAHLKVSAAIYYWENMERNKTYSEDELEKMFIEWFPQLLYWEDWYDYLKGEFGYHG